MTTIEELPHGWVVTSPEGEQVYPTLARALHHVKGEVEYVTHTIHGATLVDIYCFAKLTPDWDKEAHK